MQYTCKSIPQWKESLLSSATKDDIENLSYQYELLLDPRKYSIYFFGTMTTLNAQEYKFLKAILTKKGERVSANRLMNQIKSNCKPEIRQILSYRIKSKIKAKLKKIAPSRIPLEDNNWVIIDKDAKKGFTNTVHDINGNALELMFQNFDFERYFSMLISVKDGYYYTDFQPA